MNSTATRKIRTRLGMVTPSPCPMSELKAGERFVGPDGSTVYKVTTSCGNHPRRWLRVWDLSMTDAEAKGGVQRRGRELGEVSARRARGLPWGFG